MASRQLRNLVFAASFAIFSPSGERERGLTPLAKLVEDHAAASKLAVAGHVPRISVLDCQGWRQASAVRCPVPTRFFAQTRL